MKKIPTLFERTFENHKVVSVTGKVFPGMEWALEGEGVATVKYDGSCCAIFNGRFWKRYDAKHGKQPPNYAVPCGMPDPITGHWPHWVPVDDSSPADKWYAEALWNAENAAQNTVPDGTYEAIGPHFQNNPYKLDKDILVKHGTEIVDVERTFMSIRDYLEHHNVEGLVFWKDGEPQCKIKRKDFGFAWPV